MNSQLSMSLHTSFFSGSIKFCDVSQGSFIAMLLGLKPEGMVCAVKLELYHLFRWEGELARLLFHYLIIASISVQYIQYSTV